MREGESESEELAVACFQHTCGHDHGWLPMAGAAARRQHEYEPTPGAEDDREDAAEHYKTRRDQVAHVHVLV